MKISFDYKKLLNYKQKIARVTIITMLILATLFLFLFRTGNQPEKVILKQTESSDATTIQSDISEDVIIVDVAGEVKSPSVIELPMNSRINDAIKAAGGLTNLADISQINRAAMLSDGDKVYIPTLKVSQAQDGATLTADPAPNNVGTNDIGASKIININLATANELEEIPGVGPVTAEKIIQYRIEHGLFRKLEDLTKISGIGDKTFEKMKSTICL